MADYDFQAVLDDARHKGWDDRTLAQRAADMAQELLPAALRLLTADERNLLSALSALAGDDKNRAFLTTFCKEVLHAPNATAQTDTLRRIIRETGGVPTIFSTMDRFRLKTVAMSARGVLGRALNADISRIFRSTFRGLALPTRMDKVGRFVADCAKDGVQPLFSLLTPQVFGNKGAATYMRYLEQSIANQEGVGLSVQPWRLAPHMDPASPGVGAKALSEKLRGVLRLCTKGSGGRPVIVESGTSDTFPIVVEALKTVLAGAEFRHTNVALEIPAYLPGSAAILRELADWASARAAKGNNPLKVLITKGSHLDAERPLAHKYGEAHAAFPSKAETEARFKQLIHAATAAEGLQPVVGTHNVFDIAYALLDWARSKREGKPGFAFLLGQGNHWGRLLAKLGATVWLTTPVAGEEGAGAEAFETFLLHTIVELSRPDGYLTAGYAVESTSLGWSRMRQQFLAALSGRDATENAGTETGQEFTPGTLARLLDRSYVDSFYAAAQAEQERPQPRIDLVLGGEKVDSPLCCIHRSLTAPGQEDYRFISADYAAVNLVLQNAEYAAAHRRDTRADRRKDLAAVAKALGKNRTQLMAVMVRDAGYTLRDAETEMRNAIDACRYYAASAQQDGLYDGTQAKPLGVVVVAPNRTHPLADAVAGTAAAWAMGNAVVYKPAAYTTLLGDRLTAVLREAGLQEPYLQYLPALDNQISLRLMVDRRVGGVIHPAEPQNANRIASTSQANLMAQPCGMSTVYVSAAGDWAKAVQDVVKTAFRRSGQSPDCPHLMLVQAQVYDDPRFTDALKDAVSCLRAEPGWREGADVGPLSFLLEEDCWHMLTDADDHETWLVQPLTRQKGSLIWTPGVRTGVGADSSFLRYAHGLPLLGLMRVGDVEEAAALQQHFSAGLSAAIYSNSADETDHWRKTVSCANICINCCPEARPGLHPLGCWSPSLLGTTPLPGGPSFLTTLCSWEESALPQSRGRQRNIPFTPWEVLHTGQAETMRLTSAADSLSYWWENEFGTGHELCSCPGETTTLRYLPVPVCMRVEAGMDDTDVCIAIMAALKAGGKLQLSLPEARPWMQQALAPLSGISVHEESRAEYELRFDDLAKAGFRVRDTAATPETRARAAECSVPLITAPVLANARIELLHFLREQTVNK